MYRFMNLINERYNQNFTEYSQLHQWSIDNIPDFWTSMWDVAGIIASQPYDRVVDDLAKMPGASGFQVPDSTLPKTSSATGTIRRH